MPSFAEVRQLIAATPNGPDVVRRKYLQELAALTGNPVVLYAVNFGGPPSVITLDRQDVQHFMAALVGLTGDSLDLVLHSPGGQAEATEQIVLYLRKKFSRLRVIVPQNAMSAATMLACAADEIVMGKHSALGPTDPQIVLPTTGGAMAIPAHSILDEFQQAQALVNAGSKPILWVERLGSLPFGFLAQTAKLIALSQKLVGDWLTTYMFRGEPDAQKKAEDIAKRLSSNPEFLTHGRPIGIDQARGLGLKVAALEDDQALQEAVLSLFHATVATFQMTPCVKVVENSQGKGTFLIVNQPRG